MSELLMVSSRDVSASTPATHHLLKLVRELGSPAAAS